MSLKIVTPPTTEPISLSEMKTFSRIDSDTEITIMETMIVAARQEAEKITRRQLITATWDYRLDSFPDIIYLPLSPLQTVSSVKYLDYSGTEKTLVLNTDYLVDSYSEPARITPCYGQVWPITYPVVNAVRIVFVAGYGNSESDVPPSIKNWIMAFAGTLYENRETDIVANITQAYTHIQFLDGLLDNYRVFGME